MCIRVQLDFYLSTIHSVQVGACLSEDPEEEKAQKALKSMLNKITPDNFDRIKVQIVATVDERKKARTLQSFIDQIFDKALTEVNFSELYASLVKEYVEAMVLGRARVVPFI